MELLKDRGFKKGFHIGHVDALVSKDPIGTWLAEGVNEPDWKLCQWCTRFNILAGEKITNESEKIIKNKAKKVVLSKEYISLEILAQHEYLHPRKDGEGWPHLLLEQFFKKKYLRNFEKLNTKLDISFDSFTDFMEEKNELHTCQFQWFFAIGKRNAKETEDFFWFGLGFSDYPRYQFAPPYQAIDGGKEEHTNKFIYIMDSRQYLSEPLIPGKKASVNYNCFEEIKKAFKIAKEKGYLKNVEFNDLEILSTNLGIEMTGTFQAQFTIYRLSCKV